MIDALLSAIAPHLCFGCGKTGGLLCDNCKYNIVSEPFSGCISCGDVHDMRISQESCQLPYSRAWCVGERSGELRRLIDAYKFENAYAAHKVLAQLLDSHIEQLPKNVIVVPLPTVASHVRQRGYDHALLMAKAFARYRRLPVSRALRRVTATRQRSADRATRLAQAKNAFAVKGKLQNDHTYLLIDDVITTGASLRYATEALHSAGAGDVWAAVIARQPLD